MDTHFIIWVVTEPRKLSKRIQEILADPENRIIVSAISCWEISLKQSLGKLQLEGGTPEDLPESCLKIGFEIEPLSAQDSSTYHHLTGEYHRDPFDPMLIWQAINNNYILISDDNQVKKYSSEGLKVIW